MRKTTEALFEVCHIGEFIPVNSQRRPDRGAPSVARSTNFVLVSAEKQSVYSAV